ncbi:shootin-1 isoform X1 [Xiphophorus hellerii]|uniref:shootin-1 isoform X1 n=2 Tax=Xiphophorus hellerii TaxID=8084 RepID=UPI0013B37C30|nr:shootin-1-like isoform X1 [Xiphophorus hellerii]
MWIQDEESTVADSDEDSCLSSEDWEDIQCEILEKQRDEANQRLMELEEASNQLLKEMNMLEIQFQVERSCRESAEALALKVSKENTALKRKSQMLLPLISSLPEDLATVTLDPEADLAVDVDAVDCDVVDGLVVNFRESNSEENLLLESQAKITAMQASLDGLLAEKLQLEHQVEELTREQDQLREQLVAEAEEKEAILRKMSKQTKTMTKIKRVSQLVTEEFTEMSQQLELEQGLRQHAEVFAHQMLAEQKAAERPSTMEACASEADVRLRLQRALTQICGINTALCNIQRYYQDQIKPSTGAEEELRDLREQLRKSEEERKMLEGQLSQVNAPVTELREQLRKSEEGRKTLEGQLSQVNAPVTELREQLRKSEDGRKMLEGQLSQVNAPVTELREQLRKSEEERKILEGQLSQVNAPVTELREQLRKSEEGRKTLEGQLSQVNAPVTELREQLRKTEEERKMLEGQLSQVEASVTELREEVKHLQERMNTEEKNEDLEEVTAPPLPPPPPPPPPPLPSPTPVINLQDFLRSRKHRVNGGDNNKPAPLKDIKAKAVDEMMERIKRGIVLRPIQNIQEEDSSWRDQRSDNRKSAVLELKGMLDNIKRQHLRRVPSRRGIGRNVGEAELQLVLQRRRRAMGENQDRQSSAPTCDLQPGQQRVPAAGDCPWAGESGSAPVLRRLKQNREKRDSRIRASALILSHGGVQQPLQQNVS